MKNGKLCKVDCPFMAEFYKRRVSELRSLSLADVLNVRASLAYKAVRICTAAEIVEQLLSAYMVVRDEDSLRSLAIKAGAAKNVILSGAHYLEIIEAMNGCSEIHRLKFEEEWSKAVNRLTGEFIKIYCGKDGAIDWRAFEALNRRKRMKAVCGSEASRCRV